MGDAHPKLDMATERALLSPVFENQSLALITPPLAVHVEINFTDPVIRSRYYRSYGSSPAFEPTPRICRGLMRRIERCSEELISRKDSGALDVFKDDSSERKPLRFEMTFRIIRRGKGEWAEMTFRSYQKQPLTVEATKEIMLDTHRMVGFFLRRHDRNFLLVDSPAPEMDIEESQTAARDGSLSLLCVPHSRFNEATQAFDFDSGYNIELSFRSRNPQRKTSLVQKSIRVNSTQAAPLTLSMSEDLLRKGLQAINHELDTRKKELEGRFSRIIRSHNSCSGAVELDLRISNNLGLAYAHVHRSIQTNIILFRHPEGRDCDDFLSRVETALISYRDDTDAKINLMDDFELNVCEIKGVGWKLRQSLKFALGSSSSHGRQTIQAALDRIQTGIGDVIRGNNITIRITADKRGHLILDKAIVAHETRGQQKERFASPDEEQRTFISRLKTRIQADIDLIFEDSCSIDDIPGEDEENTRPPTPAQFEQVPSEPSEASSSSPPSLKGPPKKFSRSLSDRLHGSPKRFIQKVFSMGRKPPESAKPLEPSKPSRVRSFLRSTKSTDSIKSTGHVSVAGGGESSSKRSSKYGAITEERPPSVDEAKPARRSFSIMSRRSIRHRVSNESTLIEEGEDAQAKQSDRVCEVKTRESQEFHAQTICKKVTSDSPIPRLLPTPAQNDDRASPSLHEPQKSKMDTPGVYEDAREYILSPMVLTRGNTPSHFDEYSTAPSTPALSSGGSSARNSILIAPAFVEAHYPVLRDFHVAPELPEPGIEDGAEVVAESEPKASLATEPFSVAQADLSGPAKQLKKPALKLDGEPRGPIDPVGQSTAQTPTPGPEVKLVEPTTPLPTPEDTSNTTILPDPDTKVETSPVGLQVQGEEVGAEDAAETDCAGHPDFPTREVRNAKASQEPNGDSYLHVLESEIKLDESVAADVGKSAGKQVGTADGSESGSAEEDSVRQSPPLGATEPSETVTEDVSEQKVGENDGADGEKADVVADEVSESSTLADVGSVEGFEDASGEQNIVPEATEELSAEELQEQPEPVAEQHPIIDFDAATALDASEPESLPQSVIFEEVTDVLDITDQKLASEEQLTAPEAVDQKPVEEASRAQEFAAETALNASEPETLFVPTTVDEVVDETENSNLKTGHIEEELATEEEESPAPETVDEKAVEDTARTQHFDVETALNASELEISPVLTPLEGPEHYGENLAVEEQLVPEEQDPASEDVDSNLASEPSLDKKFDAETSLNASEPESLPVPVPVLIIEVVDGSNIKSEHTVEEVTADEEPATEASITAPEVAEEQKVDAKTALDASEPESLPALDTTPVSEVNDGSEIKIDQSDEDATANQGMVSEEHAITPCEEVFRDIWLDAVAGLDVLEPERLPAPFELIGDDGSSDLNTEDATESAIPNREPAPEEQDTATDDQHITARAVDGEPVENVSRDENFDVSAALAASEPESLTVPSKNNGSSDIRAADVADQKLASEAMDEMPAEEVSRDYKIDVVTMLSASEPESLPEPSEAPEGVDVPEIETVDVEEETATTVETASEEQVAVPKAVDETAPEASTFDAEVTFNASEPESLPVATSSEEPELVDASLIKTEDVQEEYATVPEVAAEENVTTSEIVDEKVAKEPKFDVEIALSASEPQTPSVPALLQETELVDGSDNKAEDVADNSVPDVEQAPEEQVTIPEIVEEQPTEEQIREHKFDETALNASKPETLSVPIENLRPDAVADDHLISEEPTNVSETYEQETSEEPLCDTETALLVSELESLLVPWTSDTEPIGGSDIEAGDIGAGAIAAVEPVSEEQPTALEIIDEPSQGRLGEETALNASEEIELVDSSDVKDEDLAADVVAGVDQVSEEQSIAPEALEDPSQDERLDTETTLNTSEPESSDLPVADIVDSSDKSEDTVADDNLAFHEQATVREAVSEETTKDILKQSEAEEITPVPTEGEIVGNVETTMSEVGDQLPTEDILTQLDSEEALATLIEAEIVNASEADDEKLTEETKKIPSVPVADEVVEAPAETEIVKNSEATASEASDEMLAEILMQLEFEETPAILVEAEGVKTIENSAPEADDASPAEELSQDEIVNIQTELEAEEIAAVPKGAETTEDIRVATPETVDEKPTEEGFQSETVAVPKQLESGETAALPAEAGIVNNPAEAAPEAVDEIPASELSEAESTVSTQLEAEQSAPSKTKIDIIDVTDLTALEALSEELVAEASQDDTAPISTQADAEEIVVAPAEVEPAENVEIAAHDATEDEAIEPAHQDHTNAVQTQSQAEEDAALTQPTAENEFGASEVADEKPTDEASQDEAVAISPQLEVEESVTAPAEAETVENFEAVVHEAVVEQQLAAELEVQVEDDAKISSLPKLPLYKTSHAQEDITVAGTAFDDVNSSGIIEKELANEVEVQASSGLKEEVNEHVHDETEEEPVLKTEHGLEEPVPEVIISPQNEEATIAIIEDEIPVIAENNGRKEEIPKKQEKQEPVIEQPAVAPTISVKHFTHQLPEDSVTSEVTAVSDELQTTEASSFGRHHKQREYVLDDSIFLHPNRASTSTFSSTSSWSSNSDAASFMTHGSVDTYRPSFEEDEGRPEPEPEPAYFQRRPQTAGLLGLQRDSPRFIEVGLRGALGDISHLHGHNRRKSLPFNSPRSSEMGANNQKHRRAVSSFTKKESKPEPHKVGEGEGDTVIPKMMLLFASAVALGRFMTKG